MKLRINSYYNYFKGKKDTYRVNKKKIYELVDEIYHEAYSIPGYKTMKIYLKRKGIFLSKLTATKYMNKDLKIKSVTQKKNSKYIYGKVYKKLINLINQDFIAVKKNVVWC